MATQTLTQLRLLQSEKQLGRCSPPCQRPGLFDDNAGNPASYSTGSVISMPINLYSRLSVLLAAGARFVNLPLI